MNCIVLHVLAMSMVVGVFVSSPPTATTQSQIQANLSLSLHLVAAAVIIAQVPGHNQFALVVVTANQTCFFKPPQHNNGSWSIHKYEEVSTYGDNSTNMVADMADSITEQLRRLAIQKLATNALQLVVVDTSTMPFAILLSAVKHASIQFDAALHEGKNVGKNATTELFTVLTHEMLCQTICRQLFPMAVSSPVCRVPCQLAVAKLFRSFDMSFVSS